MLSAPTAGVAAPSRTAGSRRCANSHRCTSRRWRRRSRSRSWRGTAAGREGRRHQGMHEVAWQPAGLGARGSDRAWMKTHRPARLHAHRIAAVGLGVNVEPGQAGVALGGAAVAGRAAGQKGMREATAGGNRCCTRWRQAGGCTFIRQASALAGRQRSPLPPPRTSAPPCKPRCCRCWWCGSHPWGCRSAAHRRRTSSWGREEGK